MSNKNKKTVLGIDPGSTTIGYGLISLNNYSKKLKAVEYGFIDLSKFKEQEIRLLHLHKDIKELIIRHKPNWIAIENIFFFKNAKTITSVIQSKGVILLAAAQEKIDVIEYTPLQIKQTIGGYGKASKDFIQKIIQSSLEIKNKIRPDDASDALATALCHLRHLTQS